MATLTTYTQALQHIATLEFDTPKRPLKAFSFIPNGQSSAGHTLTLECAMKSDAPILHGHIYRIDADWFTPSIYGRLHNATMTAAVTELQFKPLNAEAEEIVKAALAELDTHEAKPAKAFKVKDYFGGADISPEREALARINQIAAEYVANTATPRFAYDGHSYWREGEGNNP